MFGICNLSIVSMRLEPSDRSEQVSQVLFGEHFKIIETTPKWVYIEMAFDGYKGWIDSKQFQYISEEDFDLLDKTPIVLCADLVEYITTADNTLTPISMGCCLSFLDVVGINNHKFIFDGLKICGTKDKSNVIETALLYLNAPYLWGGKSPFGIDCSGFTQMVYKLNGYFLYRDACEQVKLGEPLSFIEESEPGDLAFFDNEEGAIIHVGILMENNYIIHASGKVRIDRLDHLGIYNVDTKRHTHKLRVIKKIIEVV
ncbi:MAG TPA: hydrolase Nlp/P60 [Flavobacterium sp.]|nr:hydrolase Nlp/P60 [Flavobacterium sp.]